MVEGREGEWKMEMDNNKRDEGNRGGGGEGRKTREEDRERRVGGRQGTRERVAKGRIE
jgi:hypothetical protein